MSAMSGPSDLDRARDPQTSADELGKLVLASDPIVVEAALANPQTPIWAIRRVQRERAQQISNSDAEMVTDASSSYSSPAGSGTTKSFHPHEEAFSSRALRQTLTEARRQAGSLNAIAGVLAGIGITGGVIVALLGLVVIFNDETLIGFVLIAGGVVAILFWTFIGTFAQAIGKTIHAWMLWMERGT